MWPLTMCCFVLVLLTLTPCVLTVNPGFKAVLTDKGLHYASHVGTAFLLENMRKVSIPNIEGDISIGKLGSIHYQLTGMTVVEVNLPEPTVTFIKDTGVKVGMDGVNVALGGKWHTHYSFINDGGTFNLAVLNMGMSAVLELGKDEQGQLSVKNSQCDSSIGGTQINFHGGASWIFKYFVDSFKGYIMEEIQKRICPMLNQFVATLENGLEEIPVSFRVNQNLLVQIPLLVSPIVQSSDMELDFKGEFHSINNNTEPPFSAGPFDLPQPAGFMLAFGLSEFSINSAFYAYFSAGLLQVNITDDMIPKFSPIRLNTTSLGTFIPQLPKMFPNLLVLLQTYTTDTPMTSFHSDNVTLNVSGSSKAYCIQPNSTLTPLFRLDTNISFSGRLFISEEKLKGSVTLNNFTLTLGSSEIGPFQMGPLRDTLLKGIQMFLLVKVNAKLSTGIPVPVLKNIQLVNSVLKVNEGFVAIATDAAISLPEPKS